MLRNHVFWSSNLNCSEMFRLSVEDIFGGTLDIDTKKLTNSGQFWGGGCMVRYAGSCILCDERDTRNEYT